MWYLCAHHEAKAESRTGSLRHHWPSVDKKEGRKERRKPTESARVAHNKGRPAKEHSNGTKREKKAIISERVCKLNER